MTVPVTLHCHMLLHGRCCMMSEMNLLQPQLFLKWVYSILKQPVFKVPAITCEGCANVHRIMASRAVMSLSLTCFCRSALHGNNYQKENHLLQCFSAFVFKRQIFSGS